MLLKPSNSFTTNQTQTITPSLVKDDFAIHFFKSLRLIPQVKKQYLCNSKVKLTVMVTNVVATCQI